MASGPWSLFRSEPEKKDKRAPLLNIESFDDDENPSDCAACELRPSDALSQSTTSDDRARATRSRFAYYNDDAEIAPTGDAAGGDAAAEPWWRVKPPSAGTLRAAIGDLGTRAAELSSVVADNVVCAAEVASYKASETLSELARPGRAPEPSDPRLDPDLLTDDEWAARQERNLRELRELESAAAAGRGDGAARDALPPTPRAGVERANDDAAGSGGTRSFSFASPRARSEPHRPAIELEAPPNLEDRLLSSPGRRTNSDARRPPRCKGCCCCCVSTSAVCVALAAAAVLLVMLRVGPAPRWAHAISRFVKASVK